jgi:hypothetical protein
LLKNGNLCSRNGVAAKSLGRLHAALITNSDVSEQEMAAATAYCSGHA